MYNGFEFQGIGFYQRFGSLSWVVKGETHTEGKSRYKNQDGRLRIEGIHGISKLECEKSKAGNNFRPLMIYWNITATTKEQGEFEVFVLPGLCYC